MFLSLSLRVRVNAGILDTVRSSNGGVKHRRAPMVVKKGDGYELRYVPAISSTSIAHSYQSLLAGLAGMADISVCGYCRRGVFVKHARDDFLEEGLRGIKDPHELEKEIIRLCVVEDIGGFTYTSTSSQHVARPSRISFSYILPVEEFIEVSAFEPQVHVRSNQITGDREVYSVEISSAIYGLLIGLDIEGIGFTSRGDPAVSANERLKRVELSVKALAHFVLGAGFGVKRARSVPSWEIIGLVAAVSHPLPFYTSSPLIKDYVSKTVKRAETMIEMMRGGTIKVNEMIKIYIYPAVEDLSAKRVEVIQMQEAEDLMRRLLEDVTELYWKISLGSPTK